MRQGSLADLEWDRGSLADLEWDTGHWQIWNEVVSSAPWWLIFLLLPKLCTAWKCLAAYSAGRCTPEEGVTPTRTVGKRLDLKVGLDSPLLVPQIESRSFCRQTVSSSMCVKGEAEKLCSLFSLWRYDKKPPIAKFERTADYDSPGNPFREWTVGSTVELHLSGR